MEKMAPRWGLVNLLHHYSDVLYIFAFCSLSRAQCYAGGCCVHLFLILHSVTSLWQFEISHGGRVYTEKIGTCYKQNFQLLNIYQCAIGDNPSSPANFLVKLCIPDQLVDFFSPSNQVWSMPSWNVIELCTTFSSGKG